MPRRCIINNCLTKGSVPNKSMYKFPKDIDLCKKWLEVIKNPKLDKIFATEGVLPLNKRVFVCSDHFETKWLRDVKEPSQGLFLGAIPSINLNLSMDKLLSNLRRNEMYKEFGLPKKMFSKFINVTQKHTNDFNVMQQRNIDHNFMQSNIASGYMEVEKPAPGEVTYPTSHTLDNTFTNTDTPLDTLSAKDEQLLMLIRNKKMNEKLEGTSNKINEPKKIPAETTAPSKFRRKKKDRIVQRKPKTKKLKLRIKGTDKFINIIVTLKSVKGDDIELSMEGLDKTIKILTTKRVNSENQPMQRNSIKVMMPTSINGKEVQLERSEISKIINLVNGPRAMRKKGIRNINSDSRQNTDEELQENGGSFSNVLSANEKTKGFKSMKNKQLTPQPTPLKNVYKKTTESSKSMRDFIESYFGEIVKCPCDFTPQENILNISQRIIDLKKKLVSAQKMLAKHKTNNRKISSTIEELRKQIPEKPERPPQKGQLIKCIIPKSKISEKYTRGKHRFTKTLKTFALDLFFSSPLSYSILEKIYLLPSRKTLKRWLVHPQNNSPDLMTMARPNNEYLLNNDNIDQQSMMQEHTQRMDHHLVEQNHHHHHHSGLIHGGIEPMTHVPDPMLHSHMDHLGSNMGGIQDNIEPLHENIDDIMFRNDLAAAIMNT